MRGQKRQTPIDLATDILGGLHILFSSFFLYLLINDARLKISLSVLFTPHLLLPFIAYSLLWCPKDKAPLAWIG